MNSDPLVIARQGGLYCPAGNFHIDPWTPVERAIITHAHSDHARSGSTSYLTTTTGAAPLRVRLGPDANIQTLHYGEVIELNGVRISLHPAGHVLGSAQVRLEHAGQRWVISGDYKNTADPTCEPFEPVQCDTFITESTYGLPIYRWPNQSTVFDEINAWWQANREQGWTSVLFTYPLGKSQRMLAGIDPGIGPIIIHGAVRRFNEAYQAAGISLPESKHATELSPAEIRGKALVIAPPSAQGTPWLRRFVPFSGAIASGWMQIRGARRRRSVDRGFIISDHADWPALLETIHSTGATNIGVTHGYTHALARWLQEKGYNAWSMTTRYGEEEPNEAETEPA